MDKAEFIQRVRMAGIVGEGGAGFPAQVKYNAQADTIIANGCECEPLLHTDQHIMAHQSREIGRALKALGEAAGATRLVLALKKKHAELIEALRAEPELRGIELFLLDDFYPAGDEQILTREVTGRSVPPLGIPIAVNTIAANVGTLARVGRALEAEDAPVIDKFLTVTGEVSRPGIVRAPLGAALADCLEMAGGTSLADPVFIIGGPMMGRLVAGREALAGEVVTKTSGGLIVLPAGHHLHLNAVRSVEVLRRRAASTCIQCRACSDLCPRRLIGHPFETHRIMRAFAARQEISAAGEMASLCSECGACEQYACPMGMSPRRVNQAVKGALRAASRAYAGTKTVHEGQTRWRDSRKIPTARLAARLGLGQYLHTETPYLGDVSVGEVSIPLRQHIGAPAIPVVQMGDRVRAGDLIGEIPSDALGARIHASVSGQVGEVGERIRIITE